MRFRILSSRLAPLALAAILCLLAACGAQDTPPALGEPVTLTLAPTGDVQLAGTIGFTPIAAMRIAVYYQGKLIPTSGAKTPAQLRIGGCFNTAAALLTDGNPTSVPLPGPTPTTPPVSPLGVHSDPAGGSDVPLASGADRYVTITARPNDPSAPVLACGQPLSANRQYFDLYAPEETSNGIATGSALINPISATRITFAVRDGNAALHPTSWAVHTGSCTGPILGGGTLGADGMATAVLYATLDTATWQIVVTHSNGATSCYPVR
jgi:hypothetical protein